ncbi:MAG: hypothetical protein ABJM43_22630 [Paracoccaceae bacterium]
MAFQRANLFTHLIVFQNVMKDRLTVPDRDKAKAAKNPWHTSSASDWPTGSMKISLAYPVIKTTSCHCSCLGHGPEEDVV